MNLRKKVGVFLAALATFVGVSVVTIASPASASVVQEGPWTIRPDNYPGFCLDVRGVSTANGALLQIYTCLGGTNQQFYTYRDTSGNLNQIVAAHSSKCLDVVGASTASGAAIQQYTCLGRSQLNQIFAISYNSPGGYSTIHAVHTGNIPCVKPYTLTNGSDVIQGACGDAKWDLVPW